MMMLPQAHGHLTTSHRGEKENLSDVASLPIYYGMSSSGNEMAKTINAHFTHNNESFY